MRAVGVEGPTAADGVVDLLVELGMDTFFGIPGGPIIPMFDAILTHPRARLIESRQESGACFAAMGYHCATGRIPVVVTTAGPGATNAVTGIVAASLERVPMLIVCGDVPWASTGGRLLQDSGERSIGIDRMLAPMLRRVVRVARGESASSQVLAAVRALSDPDSPGPALVVLPLDHAGHRTRAPHLPFVPTRSRPRPVDEETIALLERHLRRASRPLLVIGAACRPFGAEIERLVAALQVPFVTTPQAKGIVSEHHPLSLRTCGMSASQWARGYMKGEGADVTVAIGTDLDDVSTAGTPPIGPRGWLAHVDVDAEVMGRNFPTALGIVAGGRDLALALAERFEGRGAVVGGPEIAAQARSGSPFDCAGFATDPSVPIAPHRVIADLQAAVPEATFVTDIGEHMLFALHYLRADDPRAFVIHLGLGSMGSGIGSAIGLALGDRSRPVVCVCGDGGMQMMGAELLVAVRERLPIAYVVFNDARYNMVYHGYRLTFDREAQWSSPPVDFVEWARAMGARAARIDAPGQIDRALIDELADGPLVLDVRQDASVRIRGDGRVEAIRQMSLLHEAAEEGDA
jgi:acetolactate synthase-1/2/3 large subunit